MDYKACLSQGRKLYFRHLWRLGLEELFETRSQTKKTTHQEIPEKLHQYQEILCKSNGIRRYNWDDGHAQEARN